MTTLTVSLVMIGVEIYMKKSTNGYELWNFEQNYEDEFIRITYYDHGNLDGKVSSVIIK